MVALTQGLLTMASRQAPSASPSCSFIAMCKPHHPVANKDLYKAQAPSPLENLMSIFEMQHSACTHLLRNTCIENAYVTYALSSVQSSLTFRLVFQQAVCHTCTLMSASYHAEIFTCTAALGVMMFVHGTMYSILCILR